MERRGVGGIQAPTMDSRNITFRQKSDEEYVNDFISKNFEKRECIRFRSSSNNKKCVCEYVEKDVSDEPNLNESESNSETSSNFKNADRKKTIHDNGAEVCECGYNIKAHSQDVHLKESESQPYTKVSPTNAFGKLDFCVRGKNTAGMPSRRYVRLDYKTDVNKISKFLNETWIMGQPDVIISVVSDSDCFAVKGSESNEAKRRNTMTTVCSTLVEAATSTNAWIITGGLDKGVDELIGNEVKHRLREEDQIPEVLLGISNWGCLAKKKDLLIKSFGPNGYESESNSTGLSLNQHHTHFLLVDDGTLNKSGCECELRQEVELALTINDTNGDLDIPLIYILIGGGEDAFKFVEHALKNQIPVICAEGTGGAADILSQDVSSKGTPTLNHMAKIIENTYMYAHYDSSALSNDEEIQKAIQKIKAETIPQLIFDIVELLDKSEIEPLKDLIKDFKTQHSNTCITTNALLIAIKDFMNRPNAESIKATPNRGKNHIDKRMRVVIEEILLVNGIQEDKARKFVSDLKSEFLCHALGSAKRILSILKSSQKHLLKQLSTNYIYKEKSPITSLIVDALREAKSTKAYAVRLYALAADWDTELSFRKLIQDKWMIAAQEEVFRKLLKKSKPPHIARYVKLIIQHNSKSNWLLPQEDELKEFPLCRKLLSKIGNAESNNSTRIKGKVLFIWCVKKKMPESAMLFWKQGLDCLAMALVAYKESQELEKEFAKKKGHEQMKKQKEFFSNLALDFLKTCYEDNQENTRNLLIGDVDDLDNRCPFEKANEAHFEEFFNADATQDLFNDIWTREINIDCYKYIPMLISEACPLLAPALLDIETPEVHNDKEQKRTAARISNYFSKVEIFIDTPLVKFSYWFISYIAFLTLFSFVMLTQFRIEITIAEIILTIWTFILIIEEVKQVIGDIDYHGNKWNYFDIGALTLYITGFIMRIVPYRDSTSCHECLYNARIVLAFSLMLFFLRTLQFLSIYKSLGPQIYMIHLLVSDLVVFLVILGVFVSAYGVVSNVILYPNQPPSATLLKDVFYDAWWSVLQQFNREDVSGTKCNTSQISKEYCLSKTDPNVDYVLCKENYCPADNWVVSVLLAFYALITCIMLLNVLIAMFNKTFTDVNDAQVKVSKTMRCRLIYEYISRSKVPPPLCVFTYPYAILKHFFKKVKSLLEKKRDLQVDNTEDPSPNANDNKDEELRQSERKMQMWEHKVVTDYYKENKDAEGWSVALETPKYFDEENVIRSILQQIQNQAKEENSSKETHITYNYATSIETHKSIVEIQNNIQRERISRSSSESEIHDRLTEHQHWSDTEEQRYEETEG